MDKYILPLSLYIHIPWCEKKCYYCDFHSYKINNNNLFYKYKNHLIKDLLKDIKFINNRKIESIFIGGGTPNLFPSELISELLIEIKKIIKCKKNVEITIEVNPNNIKKNDLFIYKNSGINRISVGAQSFNNKILKTIGRNHKKNNIINIINNIKLSKIKNFNIDLMYGLPKQKVYQSIHDIKKIINLKPTHISWYQLSIEPKTFFYYKKPVLPKDKILYNMYNLGKKILKKHGYKQYEISSYSNKKFQCKHNLNYWKFGDYIGIGCGSHSKITKNNGNILRVSKIRHPNKYILGEYIDKKNIVLKKDIPLEYFMNRFRLNKNILKKEFLSYTKLNINYIRKEIDKAIHMKFLKEDSKKFILTEKGKLFLNYLLEIFIK